MPSHNWSGVEERIEAMENDDATSEPKGDGCGLSLALWMIVVLVAATVYGVVKLVPQVTDDVENLFRKQDACVLTDSDIYAAEDVLAFCTGFGFSPAGNCSDFTSEQPAGLQETCDAYCATNPSGLTCPEGSVYVLPEGVEWTELNEYIQRTDDIIDDMSRTLGKVEALYEMYLSYGDSSYSRSLVIQTKPYNTLLDDIHIRSFHVFNDTLALWPPPPYNSSNPLLDAHARLTNAVALLVRADAYLYQFETMPTISSVWKNAYNLLDDIQQNIDSAEYGFSLAR